MNAVQCNVLSIVGTRNTNHEISNNGSLFSLNSSVTTLQFVIPSGVGSILSNYIP